MKKDRIIVRKEDNELIIVFLDKHFNGLIWIWGFKEGHAGADMGYIKSLKPASHKDVTSILLTYKAIHNDPTEYTLLSKLPRL